MISSCWFCNGKSCAVLLLLVSVGDQTVFVDFLCRLQFCMVLLAHVYCVNDIPEAKHDRLVAGCTPVYHVARERQKH